MSAASCLLTEDQFLCSICLDVFTDPVTIPCGHNFCKTCITDHWDINVPYQCPNCREVFITKPELQVNTLISEMVAKFRQSAQQDAKEVPRDVSSGSNGETLMCLMIVFMACMVLGTTMTVLCLVFLMCVLMVSDQMKLQVELKRVQQYEVDVTLDPDTAHPTLILSDDGKQVHDSDVWKNLPNNPEKFDSCVIVLAKQSFSSGRFYYEVQVKGKTGWWLGVARESVNRKGLIRLRPQTGYWVMGLWNAKKYKAAAGPAIRLSLKSPPQKVGVFVDYEEGLVSFYDVDAAALIYSFTGCSFIERLYPFFSPCNNYGGKNSAPLIISPVSH